MKIEIPTMNGFIPDCYSKFANEDQKLKGSLVDLSQFLLLMHLIRQKL